MKHKKDSLSLNGKRIYLAPANPTSKVLHQKLVEQGVEVLGFIDNLKTGEGIFNYPEDLSVYDYIVVAEGPYQDSICNTLAQRGFNYSRILKTNKNGLKRFHYGWIERSKSFKQTIENIFLSLLVGIMSNKIPNRKVVYYTEEFIDNNTLVAWQYHTSVSSGEAVLVAKNLKPIVGNSLPVLSAGSICGRLTLIRSKCIVIDHEYQGKLFDVLRSTRPFIQIFHGLPYKCLTGNKHFKHIHDHAFISSSGYFNSTYFPKLFSAKSYLTMGYPRNDVFFQMPAERCWVNTPETQNPQDIIEKTGPLWIYMPTYRDNGAFEMPFSLEKMQTFCVRTHRSLILKFHPFVAKQVIHMFKIEEAEDHVVALPGLPNIYLYPTRMNIYPWLADADLLITDYSSVAFDFLLTDKPMVFFQYDYESYYKNRGEFTVPPGDFAAGAVVKTECEFFACLTQIATNGADTDQNKRTKLLEKLNISTELACPQLVALTREIA